MSTTETIVKTFLRDFRFGCRFPPLELKPEPMKETDANRTGCRKGKNMSLNRFSKAHSTLGGKLAFLAGLGSCTLLARKAS
jgi:hypothetical protein